MASETRQGDQEPGATRFPRPRPGGTGGAAAAGAVPDGAGGDDPGPSGAASVFKAVYIDKRELKCACVGGSSNVPLGFISLTENLMMVAMAVWMALAASGLPVGAAHAM